MVLAACVAAWIRNQQNGAALRGSNTQSQREVAAHMKEVVGGSLWLQGEKAASPAQLKTPPRQKVEGGSSVML